MKFSTIEVCRIAVFVVLSAVFSQISIPLPFTPVPVTLGLLGSFVCGLFLQPKNALFAQIVYLALGAAGMPIFANFSGGLAAIIGPTGGYLIAYPIMALVISLIMRIGNENGNGAHSLVRTVLALSLALAICYLFGATRLSFVLNIPFSRALVLGVYPFIPLDLAKIAVASLALTPVRARLAFND